MLNFSGLGRLTAWVDFGGVPEVQQGLQVTWWFRHGEVEETGHVVLKVMVLVVCVKKVGV